MSDRQTRDRFHGRVVGQQRSCALPGCAQPGEFRAPGYRAPGSNGPGDYRFLCLDHVRQFNERYNFFDGMSREEIEDAQLPLAGWPTQTRAFVQAGVDSPPKWADFQDPLDAISGRFRSAVRQRTPEQREDGKPLSGEECRALSVLGLGVNADRKMLRARYSALVRAYHPDKNGGDRSHEKQLQAVLEAYQLLKGSIAFA